MNIGSIQANEREVYFDTAGAVARIHMNRPKALNTLTLGMIEAIHPQLDEWARNDQVAAVTISGEGERAFCAGGDIRVLYEVKKTAEGPAYFADFYRKEYRLNRDIFRYPKPYVAIIDGIAMGGGVGVSVHGSHRVVTERTMFAMPETGIGLFPDVGGGHFLPRCPGSIGMYMGLTGVRLDAADCLYAGIGTHFVPAAQIADLDNALAAADLSHDSKVGMGAAIGSLAGQAGPSKLAAERAQIDRHFSKDTLHDIFESLARDGGDWAARTLATLRMKSPLALHVAFRQLRTGAALDFENVMAMEYRLSQRFMAGRDFFEGVRALIVDKDNTPRWQHASIDDVRDEEIDAYFAPLGDNELNFD